MEAPGFPRHSTPMDLAERGEVPDDVPAVSPTFRDFADVLAGMRKVVISPHLAGHRPATGDRW
jgi:hypothetical protein